MNSCTGPAATVITTSNNLNRFNRLPTEIVIHIFILALTQCRSASTRTNPLIFSAVCQRWRKIAFSTTTLWTTVTVKFKQPMNDAFERVLLEEWLQRSKDLPLSLIAPFEFYDEYTKASHAQLLTHNIIDIFTSTFHRCRELTANGNSSYPYGRDVKKVMESLSRPAITRFSPSRQILPFLLRCFPVSTFNQLRCSRFFVSQHTIPTRSIP